MKIVKRSASPQLSGHSYAVHLLLLLACATMIFLPTMPDKPPSTARLEAFSDGVIAVIITIMVLELKVPHGDGIVGLRGIFPILLVYLLSFAFTGIYWINHQHLLDRVESANRLTLHANLVFLFCLSLLPFFTAYVLEKNISSFAVALYALSMMATAFGFLMLRLAVHRQLRRADDLKGEDTAARFKHLASLALYLTAVPLAYFHPTLAMIVVAAVTVVWSIPNLEVPKKMEKIDGKTE